MKKIRKQLVVLSFIIITILTTSALVCADESPAKIHYAPGNGDDVQINMQVVNGENYIFLPGTTDLSQFSLTSEEAEQTVLLRLPGGENATEVLNLDSAQWDENACSVQVEITDRQRQRQGQPLTLHVMKGSSIGSIYYRSDDQYSKGRAWIDSAKVNRGSGKATVADKEGAVRYEGKITDIHARGNSSFKDPKKSYQIKLDKKSALIDGTKKAKKWILLAQYKDPLRMSDKILKDIDSLAKGNTDRFSPKEEFVDLYYDGEYRGVYLLSEKVEIGKGRIDINDMEKGYEASEALEGRSYGDDINIQYASNNYENTYYYQEGLKDCERHGGYLLEMNSARGDEYNWFKYVCGNNRKAINIKSPELGSMADVRYISEYFQEFYDAVSAKESGAHTGRNPRTGKYYYEYCDAVSMADTYLIQTIASNLDGFKRSLYFYKDADQIMYAGPIWDMDLSLGTGLSSQIAPRNDYIAASVIAHDLIQIPHFREKVKERYLDIYQPLLAALLGDPGNTSSIWDYAETIKNSIAMDWTLWPRKYKTGNGEHLWPNETQYEEIVQYRADWLQKHKAFLDEYLGNMDPENPGTAGGNTGGGSNAGGGGAPAPAYEPTEADKAAIAAATGAIEKLPEAVTLNDAADVAAARSMYDALTSNQKSLVPSATLKVLQNAEKAIVEGIKSAVASLPADVTLENEPAVTSAMAAFNSLGAVQKAWVDAGTAQKLEKASAAISAWKEYEASVDAAQAQTTTAKVKNTKGRKLVVKWQANNNCSGYQIRCSTRKSFKSGVKKKTVKGAGKIKLTLKGLKKGEIYYVQVCPCTNVTNRATNKGGMVYGKWSKTKSAKVMK